MSAKRIDGICLLNKPQGMTSHAALQAVKRLFGASKAGHTGTLDPMATGMLPICFGEATKFSHYLLNQNKTYEANGILGAMTDTGDAWGEVLKTSTKVTCSLEELQHVLAGFVGEIAQVPPMYSALKHKGQPLYKYARAGQMIPRATRQIEVFEMQMLAFDGREFKIRTRVSKGTYIRTLIEDIGRALNSEAYMSQLHRESTAGFEQEPMYSLDAFTQMTMEERLATLLPVERAVADLPTVSVTEMQKIRLFQGQLVSIDRCSTTSTPCGLSAGSRDLATSLSLADKSLDVDVAGEISVMALRDAEGVFFGVADYDKFAGLLKSKRLWSTE